MGGGAVAISKYQLTTRLVNGRVDLCGPVLQASLSGLEEAEAFKAVAIDSGGKGGALVSC